MKSKNSFYSFLRHAAGVIGGSLVGNPDPRLAALGWALGALATTWGVSDEFTAENPGMKPPAGNGHVGMILFCFLAAGVASTFTGCASTPGAPIDLARVESRAVSITKIAAAVVLTKEPGAVDELRRVSAGVDTVFARGELTPEQLRTFLDALKIQPANRLIVATAMQELHQLILELTGLDKIDTSNLVVAAALRGAKKGIDDTIALQAGVQPAPVKTSAIDSWKMKVEGPLPPGYFYRDGVLHHDLVYRPLGATALELTTSDTMQLTRPATEEEMRARTAK